ncbi:ROK family protein [Crenobacter cavernae]|uniref:ROK family protein n=1 Tax=Crenobacter cavernae TaxID=2290923 RepID=A0ABY0FHE9_9NEIS|nr:ROK family protein [Crenobacter cavernae]RXZ44544.1 ROK family protein [Crenobacter cavernae]
MRFGIDVGGTKIELIALDGAGRAVLRRRVATPQGDYAATLAAIKALVGAAEAELGVTATLGFGTPGALSTVTSRIKNANSTCLNEQPLKDDLEALLAREVRIANDANCFALSEAADGAAAGASIVFGVILGTGVGGGLVVDGRLIEGANRVAGEWGHNPLPLPEAADLPLPACYCGRAGCIETYLSGPGMAADHARLNGVELTAAELVRLAEGGDGACAQATLERYERRLARSLATVINLIDPDVIVLGGGLSNVARLYDNVPRLWSEGVFSDAVATKLVPPAHGDSSGVRGAAWLWPA